MNAAGAASAVARGNVAGYPFVSSWQIQAPIERVWAEISQTEDWPSWRKYVAAVQQLEPGDANGVGKRLRLTFRTRLPYTLSFDTRGQHPAAVGPDGRGVRGAGGHRALGAHPGPRAARWSAITGPGVLRCRCAVNVRELPDPSASVSVGGLTCGVLAGRVMVSLVIP